MDAMKNQETNAHTLYLTPAWQQHAELITHLCQFSQNSLLVIAPQEGGKTTFINHFLQLPTKGLRKTMITAKSQTGIEDLFKQILYGFDLRWESVEATSHQLQQGAKEAFCQHQTTWTLIVDDAHLLSHEQLQALFSLQKCEATPSEQLHLVLFSEPSLELRLFSSEFSRFVQGKLYSIELESWTLHDIKSFFALETSALALNADQLAFIFARSHGLPGNVIHQKREILETQLKNNLPTNIHKKLIQHPILLSMGIGVLLGGMVLVVGSNTEGNANLEPENWTPVPVVSQIQPEFSSQPEEAKLDEPESKSIAVSLKEETVKLESVPSTQNKIVNPKKALTLEEKYLLSTNTQHYTLQLMGGNKERSIQHFVSKHGLDNSTYAFRAKRSGQDWYILVYGEYPSLQEAQAAVENLPDSLKEENIKPWVRSMGSIHKDIAAAS